LGPCQVVAPIEAEIREWCGRIGPAQDIGEPLQCFTAGRLIDSPGIFSSTSSFQVFQYILLFYFGLKQRIVLEAID
jgi:hypothetical protein